jgi:hypothetical protein
MVKAGRHVTAPGHGQHPAWKDTDMTDSSKRHDADVLREHLESIGVEFDESGVHCNWFWCQLSGSLPDRTPFYYRWKYGHAELYMLDGNPDLVRDPDAEEDPPDDEPTPERVIESLKRLLKAVG